MNHRSASMLVVIAVLLLSPTGCRAPSNESRTPTADTTLASAHGTSATPEQLPLGLALKDDGRAVELAPEQVLLVSLPANHSTGFSWVLRDPIGPALESAGATTYDVDSTAGVGTGGFETWRFRGAAAGADTIVLDYRRPWEADRPAETTVRYSVTVR